MPKQDKFSVNKWKIFIGITILWLLGTIALAFISYLPDPPTGSTKIIESAKMVFLSLGALGVILPTYISSINAIDERNTAILENTFKLVEKWDDPQMFTARRYTRELKKRKPTLSDEQLVKEIEADTDLKQSIILVINYFDQIRFSEKTGRIDCALFNKSLGYVMLDYHSRFRPWVETHGEDYLRDWDELRDLAKIK
jgi:hypothetical protein